MYRNKKALIGLLGVGILLGYSSEKSFAAADVLFNDGEVHSVTISDTSGTISVNNSSTLDGDVTVEKNGYIYLENLNSSIWKGDLTLQKDSHCSVYIENSKWNGDLNNSGSLYMNAIGSQWQGNIVATDDENGSPDIYTYIDLKQSSWEGNANIRGNYFLGHFADSSIWEGNLTVNTVGAVGENNENSVYVNVLDRSSWIGNAVISTENMSGGYMNLYVGDDSKWKGNLDYKGVATEEYLNLDVQIDRSSWEGNAAISSNRGIGKIYVIGSKWNGNLDYFISAENENGFVDVSIIDSAWEGNATISGKVETYVELFSNSSWKGDLDLRENQVSIENSTSSAGRLFLADHSLWEGRILSNEQSLDAELYNSSWLMTGDSKVASLTAEDSEVSFVTKSKEFTTLTVDGNFEGYNNLLRMNTDLAANIGDLLAVKGEIIGDSNQIAVNNQGSAWVNPANELTIVTSGGTTDGQFALANEVEVGGYEYGLKRVDNNWNLYTTGRSTTTGSASVNAFVGSYLLGYAENQTLLKRLGDLRGSSQGNEVWARVYGGEFESRGSHFLRGFGMDYTGVQAGFDKKVERTDGRGTVYVGGFLGYAKGNLDHGSGSGSIDSKSIGAYWTHIHHNGFYADLVFKYGWMKNDFKVLDTTGISIRGDNIHTEGFTGSLEVGRRYHFDQQEKQGWYVEPQAQLTVGHQEGDKFTASNGLQIKVEPFRSVLTRTGVNIGYEVKSGKNPVNVYAKAAYLHEFEGEIGVYYNGIKGTENLGSHWWLYGVGATFQLGPKHNFYLDVERTSGARFKQTWSVNGGYRFRW